MNYKGIELQEITQSQIFEPPKEMLVWDDDDDEPKIMEVWGIVLEQYHGIAPSSTGEQFPVNGGFWKHCAEIPNTNKEYSCLLGF